ncbi:MAG TPA: NYN domain-containing protein [Vicinamibacterales bacterium]|jgi:uncharacterized LabA/DUF88 family protein
MQPDGCRQNGAVRRETGATGEDENVTEERLKIAVFVDFDNIEIGVKTTLGVAFDVGTVLEAIKERGEVVTKVAYGDWTRAGDYSRLLTQHAIKMVQRNLTPGGDKNGADINLALDALEMALTHDHINAYVIVGGDSDFLSLVEKLKQYDKTVIVVGGRAFTSVILQRNCHEFIAYENLVSVGHSRRQPERGRSSGTQSVTGAFPLIRRALKVLSEREVTPQLGLLKSTLLQLDSTFSEKSYGAGSFRDFAEKLAQAGLLRLNQSGRNLLVEIKEPEPADETTDGAQAAPERQAERHHDRRQDHHHDRQHERPQEQPAAHRPPPEHEAPAEERPVHESAPEPAAPPYVPGAGEALAAQQAEAVTLLRRVIENATTPLRWPMYVRNVKQLLRAAEAGFDERRYGFGGILDLLRGCQRDGLLRLERDRQGVLRVFPGAVLQRPATASSATVQEAVIGESPVADQEGEGVVTGSATAESTGRLPLEPEQLPIIDAEPTGPTTGTSAEPVVGDAEAAPVDAAPKRRRASGGARKAAGPNRKAKAPAKPRAKKKTE